MSSCARRRMAKPLSAKSPILATDSSVRTSSTTRVGWNWQRRTGWRTRKIPFMYSFSGHCAPQSQFPHSCVCERFIYSQDRSTYFLQQKRHRHMNVKIGTEAPMFLFWKYLLPIFGIFSMECVTYRRCNCLIFVYCQSLTLIQFILSIKENVPNSEKSNNTKFHKKKNWFD